MTKQGGLCYGLLSVCRGSYCNICVPGRLYVYLARGGCANGYAKARIRICAVRMRRNMVSGYTVV